MKIKINLNDTVYCKLTEKGIARACSDISPSRLADMPTRGVQLWELLGSLGCDGMIMGSEPMLEGNTFEWRGGALSERSTTLVADVIACLDALRKSSTDPVACALAQRLALELSLDPSA